MPLISVLEDIIRCLNFMAFDQKKDVFSHHFSAIAPKMGEMKCISDIVIRAFECYVKS